MCLYNCSNERYNMNQCDRATIQGPAALHSCDRAHVQSRTFLSLSSSKRRESEISTPFAFDVQFRWKTRPNAAILRKGCIDLERHPAANLYISLLAHASSFDVFVLRSKYRLFQYHLLILWQHCRDEYVNLNR